MKNFVIAGLVLLSCSLAIVAFGGVRTETSFNTFQVCVSANPLSGGVNRVSVSTNILLDNGDPSRALGRDVLSLLNASQKAAAVTFFNNALSVVGTSQQIATPTGLPTP